MPASPLRRFWSTFRLVVFIPLMRLRFLIILGAIGFVLVKWDDLLARYEKYIPAVADESVGDPDHEFYCPMHPAVIRDTNKQKCPICFMPLAKRKKGEQTDEPLPAGVVSRVQLTPYRVVLAGVRTVPVGYEMLSRDLVTVGTIEFDERKLRVISARVKGRIDTLYVDQTGQMVDAKQPLAELYSPDLVVTVQNLLDARKNRNGVLEQVAQERLRLWGIDPKEVDEIASGRKPITHLTVSSSIKGHVLKKAVREGQYVEEGSLLFEVADLSTVWIQAQLYEDDLTFLPAGAHDDHTGKPGFDLAATAYARAFPERAFEGKLSFLFPHVDPETRTLTVRFELPNPGHELRPGMTATVSLKLTADLLAKTTAGQGLQMKDGKLLAVPEPAVIDTGAQKIVFRETLPNTFEGILVKLGPKMRTAEGATFFPVLSGLKEDDHVVAAGAFLLDAETRLNPTLGSIYIGGSGTKPGSTALRPSTPDNEAEKIAAAMKQLSPEDSKLAKAQRICPIQGNVLGSMGVPPRLVLNGQVVFVCCANCTKRAEKDPEGTLKELRKPGGMP